MDDEFMALEVIRHHSQKIPFIELLVCFENAIEAIAFLQQHEVDLVFLDINMPDITGLQLLKSITCQPMVIFTTAYAEYALQGYDFYTVDYLLKPIEFDQLLKAVNKTQHFLQTQQIAPTTQVSAPSAHISDTILVKSGTEIHQIKIAEILYIESTGNYVRFVTPHQQVMSLFSMKEVIGLLPAQDFVQIHKSFIVAFMHISLFEKHQVKVNDQPIPIGKTYREAFQQIVQSRVAK
ncbi:LytTR family DNA-binding domain-containing protein [uncultured Microscilla sp.]|uniref:LytR/AlgR family response regulator transcription factor n=1 Tax=uncultured Microscilla sp. TaxID=432653 RepID=UPI00263539D2|nr:LytTR family DNA-binding domain-containing protein [uncultured Microscilla sp.]